MSEQQTYIRLGTVDDINEIMELAMKATTENAFMPPNAERICKELYALLSKDKGFIGVITSDPSRIEGVVVLTVTRLWYSNELLLEERAIFIHPDYRSAKGGRARKLCEFSKHTADRLGIPLLIGVLSNSRTEGKIRMYQRQFGEPAGAFFLYGAKTGLDDNKQFSE